MEFRFLCTVFIVWGRVSVDSVIMPDCRPAQEGDPLTLTCCDDAKSSVRWSVSSDLSSFYDNPKEMRNRTHVCSKLTFREVTPLFRYHEISCVVPSQPFTSDGEQRAVCKMDVFHKPQNVRCRWSKQLSSNNVIFECSASHVYPQLQCKAFYYNGEGNKANPLKDDFKYYHESYDVGDDLYYKASCLLTIKNLQLSSSPTFYGVLGPWVSQAMSNITVPVKATEDVAEGLITPQPFTDSRPHSSPSTHVSAITKLPLDLCPSLSKNSAPNISVMCEANGFESPPEFVWSLHEDGLEINPALGSLFMRVDKPLHDPKYITNLTLRAERNLHATTLTCSARASGQELSDSITLTLRWPPPDPPVFQNKLGQRLETNFTLDAGTVGALSCLAEGGEPRVSRVHIICKKGDTVFVDSASDKGNSLTVDISATPDMDGELCKCSADHDTGCYDHVSTITLNVNVPHHFEGSFYVPRVEIAGKPVNLVIFVASVSGFCSVLIIVAIIVILVMKKIYASSHTPVSIREHYYESISSLDSLNAGSLWCLDDRNSITCTELLLQKCENKLFSSWSWPRGNLKTPRVGNVVAYQSTPAGLEKGNAGTVARYSEPKSYTPPNKELTEKFLHNDDLDDGYLKPI